MKFAAIALGIFFLSSCSTLHVYTGDHGTNQIKGVSSADPTSYMTEIANETSTYYTWHIGADNAPERLFWWTRVGGKYGIAMSRLDGETPDFFPVKGARSVNVDPFHNRIYYQVAVDSTYVAHDLYSVNYGKNGPDWPTITKVASSPSHFASLVTNPDNCGKLFWMQLDANGKRTLMSLTIGPDQTPKPTALNSEDFPYAQYIQYFAIDPDNETIYWGQNRLGWENDAIGKVSYTAPEADIKREEMWIWNAGREHYFVSYVGQLAIDYKGQRLYWVDMNRNWLASALLDGKNMDEREVKILDHYPVDIPTGGPNYHPTSLSLIRSGNFRMWQSAPGKTAVVSNGKSQVKSDEYPIPPYDDAKPPLDPDFQSKSGGYLWPPLETPKD